MIAIELEEMSEISSSEVRTRLRELWDGISELGADLHSLSYRLHSSTLERWGLAAGIKSFCEEFSDLQEITVELVHENVPDEIPSSTALCLFRIVQEGLKCETTQRRKQSFCSIETIRRRSSIDDIRSGRGFDPHTNRGCSNRHSKYGGAIATVRWQDQKFVRDLCRALRLQLLFPSELSFTRHLSLPHAVPFKPMDKPGVGLQR
jgi:hypothetical protein